MVDIEHPFNKYCNTLITNAITYFAILKSSQSTDIIKEVRTPLWPLLSFQTIILVHLSKQGHLPRRLVYIWSTIVICLRLWSESFLFWYCASKKHTLKLIKLIPFNNNPLWPQVQTIVCKPLLLQCQQLNLKTSSWTISFNWGRSHWGSRKYVNKNGKQ